MILNAKLTSNLSDAFSILQRHCIRFSLREIISRKPSTAESPSTRLITLSSTSVLIRQQENVKHETHK
jgi:hypothetical protein